MYKRKIEILIKAILNFGLINGINIVRKLNKNKKTSRQQPIFEIFIKKFNTKILLRSGSSDILVFIEIFIDEIYNFDTTDSCINIIIDAGANIGLTSLYYTFKYPQATIYSIEPESNNFNLLCKNVSIYPNIIPLNLALTDEDKTVSINESTSGDWGFKLGSLSEKTIIKNEVKGVSVTSLMLNHNIKNIDIFKMDIEGAEIYVFNGNTSFLDNTKYMIVELHPEINGSTQSFINCIGKNTPEYIKGKGENLILKY